MAKSRERLQARFLRRKGKSVIEIAKVLNVSKSTVSMWCRDIALTQKQKEILKKNSLTGRDIGSLKGAQTNHRRRLNNVEKLKKEAIREIGCVSKRDLLMLGIGLFWGEGSKEDNRFIFINSDPKMIMVMYEILKNVLKIPKESFKVGIQINESHKQRIDVVLKFWSSLLDLPPSQFNKTYYVKTPHKKIYENHDRYFGVLRLRVNSGSELQRRMLGYVEAVSRGSSMVEQRTHKP